MKKIVFIIGLILSLIFTINFVEACSCATTLSVEERYQTVDAIFIGKVTKINKPAFSISSDDPIKVIFDVSKSYKGNLDKSFAVETAKDSVSCGFPFNEEGEYLVYATLNDGKYETNLCSGTVELGNAQQDLEVLNRIVGESIVNNNDNKDTKLDLSQVIVMALLVLVIALLIIAETHVMRWIKGKKNKKKRRR